VEFSKLLPGGFGTLDEFMEILTLVQTNKIKRIPIILYGKDFWDPFLELFRTKLMDQYGTIGKEDMDLFVVCDTVDEAYKAVLDLVKC
jgi:predicted Rossmann-fold nucleotide-binding protein